MSKLHRKLLILVILFISFSAIEVFSSGQNGRSFPRLRNGSSELLQVTAGGHVLGFRKGGMFAASGDHALRVDFVGANDVAPEEKNDPKKTGVIQDTARPLGKVAYRRLWDGVSLVYEMHGSGVAKSSYDIEPEAKDSVERILLRYNAPVKIMESGELAISFETGEMRESRPVAWQEIEGKRVPVKVSYRLTKNGEVGFNTGSYDLRYSLVIDPVLSWNTFLGPPSSDNGRALAVDGSGNVYVAGYSDSTWGTPVNPYHLGKADAFVAKLNLSGVLQWNTFMGSGGGDYGTGLAVDGSGNVYVAGYSEATWGTPVNPYAGGGYDAFVATLNSSGVRQWNTFLGGSSIDYGNALAVDGSGNVYVVGYSGATWGAPVNPHSGSWDAFVAKLNSSGVLQWNNFLGSANDDYGYALAVDGSGNVYVAGYSYASWGGAPVNGYSGGKDVFVAKLNSSGVGQWVTFMGSGNDDYGTGLAVDGSGNVYVTGYSDASWGTPVNGYSGGKDVFVAKLNSSGVRQWNTFMGSGGGDYGTGLAVDGSGNVYVAGYSGATWGTPVNAHAGSTDAFVATLNSSGVRQWNTFLGGSGIDYGYALAVDGSGNVYIAGDSNATWGTPVNPHVGLGNVFVAKIASGIKNDFNGDWQPDILWRFYESGGPWQGKNAVWYLSQAGGDSVAALGMTPKVFAPRDLFPGPGPNKRYWSPLEAGDLLSKRPEKIRQDALEAADILKYKGEWQIDATDLREVRIVKNPGEIGMGIQGRLKTAGLVTLGSAYLDTVADLNWDIAGTGDFNRDGKTDILWRYYGSGSNQGMNAVWYLNGMNYIGADWLMTITDTNWRIESTGDFNGDGKTDILWRYYGSGPDQGKNVVWYMNGATRIGGDWLITITDTNWRIEGTGDFNGDGKTDILWRYYGSGSNLGKNAVWYMNGASYIGADMLTSVTDTNWRIEGTGDFNGDGKTDIIWRYYGGDSNLGKNAIWYMNGANYIGTDWLDTVADVNWRIKNR